MVSWPGLHMFVTFCFDVQHQFVMMATACLITFVQLTEGRSESSCQQKKDRLFCVY